MSMTAIRRESRLVTGAFQVMFVFLGLNGLRLNAPEVEVVRIMTDLAAGKLPQAGLADWIREHVSIGTLR